MAKKSKKFAVVVLDATGSMSGQEERVVTSMNEYVAELPKSCHLSVFEFDSVRWVDFYDGKAKDWKPMTTEDYKPGAMTPLYDSIAKGIEHAKSLSSEGDKVMMMIDTDGFENSSTDYTHDKITELVEECKAKGWAFQFMASGLDKKAATFIGAVGQSLGMTTQSYSYGTKNIAYMKSAYGTQSYFKGNDDWAEAVEDKDSDEESKTTVEAST